MGKKSLELVVQDKTEKGEDRIVVSISFKFTDPFELELLRHLWQFNHSHHLKRLIQKDREGVVVTATANEMEYQVYEEEEDVSSFL